MKQLFRALIPVDNHVVKKNNRPIWRGRLGKSAKLRDAELYLTRALVQEIKMSPNVYPIATYVQAKMTFMFPKEKFYTKKGSRNKKLPDLSNLYQLVEDCMQKAGVIFDDHLIDNHDGSRRIPSTCGQYFLKIELFSVDL